MDGSELLTHAEAVSWLNEALSSSDTSAYPLPSTWRRRSSDGVYYRIPAEAVTRPSSKLVATPTSPASSSMQSVSLQCRTDGGQELRYIFRNPSLWSVDWPRGLAGKVRLVGLPGAPTIGLVGKDKHGNLHDCYLSEFSFAPGAANDESAVAQGTAGGTACEKYAVDPRRHGAPLALMGNTPDWCYFKSSIPRPEEGFISIDSLP